MLELLDFQSKRMINIIQALGNNGEQLTVKEIATLNECSSKTVVNDIKFIQNSWNQALDIERHNDLYRANVRSQSHIKTIYSEIICASNAVATLVEIFIKPNQSIHYYANKTNTSITNLYNSIKSLNAKLEKYDIAIINENSTFSVQSKDRTHFRLFFTMIFLEFDLHEYQRPSEILEIIKTRIKTILKDEYAITIRLNFYSLYYFVSLIDIKNHGCTEKEDHPTINKILLENLSYYDLMKRYFPTMSNSCFVAVETQVENLFVDEDESDTILRENLKDYLMSNFRNYTKYHEDDRLRTFVDILMNYKNGFNFMPFKLPHFINRYESFSSRIKTGSPETHLFIEKMFSGIDEKFSLTLSRFIDPLIYWTTVTYPDIHLVKNNRIMIISDQSRIHAKYLRKHLAYHLSSYEFDYLHLDTCKHWARSFDANQYYRVISTCSLPNMDPNKLIITGDYISTEDLARILRSLNKNRHSRLV